MGSLEVAIQCEICPLTFWELTPHEFNLMVKAYIKRKEDKEKSDITLAYMNSLWTIQWLGKKGNHPKPLGKILNYKQEKTKQMSDNEMLEKVKILNAMLGGETIITKQ